jgi:hypothetical protein
VAGFHAVVAWQAAQLLVDWMCAAFFPVADVPL